MTKTASLIAPVAGDDRFAEIDALRGFALFGILLANLPVFLGIAFADTPERAMAIIGAMPERMLAIIVNFILDGKFYTVFSLLFGLGFALQLDRLERRGADGTAIFLRRMAVLLLIGLIHLSFVWGGDILTFYALIGFTLPLIHRFSDRVLLVLAGILIFAVPFLGVQATQGSETNWTAPLSNLGDTIWNAIGGPDETSYFTILDEMWWQTFVARAASEWSYVFSDKLFTWRIPKVMGTMLLGMWAGRKLVRGELIGNRKLLWSVVLIGFAIALPVNYLYAQQPPHTQTHWTSLIGTAPAGLAYAAGFLLMAARFPALVTALAPAGRMALTNYLAMSVVCVFVFYGAGFGLMGQATLAQGYGFGFALFAALALGSSFWLNRARQGPLEALWRRMTYGPAHAN